VHNCTATATGLGGATVSGTFKYSPAQGETKVGVYSITATFTSTNANYSGGGEIGGTLTITVNKSAIAVSPTTWKIGNLVGGPASVATIKATNSTGVTVTFAAAIDPLSSPAFALTSLYAHSCTVATGGSCSFQVSFTPTAASATAVTGTLDVSTTDTSNDSFTPNPMTAALTGYGIGPINVDNTSLTFGSTEVDTIDPTPQTVTVTNNTAFKLTSVSTAVGTDNFELGSSGTCQEVSSSKALAPGGTCTVLVEFWPQTTGILTDTLTIKSSVTPATGITAVPVSATVALTGTGTSQ
jgi:hypothetical protein